MSFGKDLKKFSEKTKITMDVVVRKVAVDLTTEIVRATPVDTGMAKNNWFIGDTRVTDVDLSIQTTTLKHALKQFSGDFSYGPQTLKDRVAIASMKWATGAKTEKQAFAAAKAMVRTDQKGNASVNRAVEFAGNLHAGGIFYIVNNLPYIMKLEYGSSKQAPSGMARVAVAKFQKFVNQAIRLVAP